MTGPGDGQGETAPPAEEAEARQVLEEARVRIQEVDELLIRTIGERFELALRIGGAKQVLGLPVMDPGREAEVIRRLAGKAREMGVDEEMTRDVFWRIIGQARAVQEDRLPDWPARPAGRGPVTPSRQGGTPPPDGTRPPGPGPGTNDPEGSGPE